MNNLRDALLFSIAIGIWWFGFNICLDLPRIANKLENIEFAIQNK